MRQKSVVLDFVEQTKKRVKELQETVKTVTRDAEQRTRAAQKVVKHATKEMARLEKLLPAKKPRKRRAKKVEAAKPVEPAAQAPAPVEAPKPQQRSKPVGTFGLGKLPPSAPVKAPEPAA